MTKEECRTARRELDLSIDGLARILKTTGRSVRRWEDGTREVPGPADVLITLMVKSRMVRVLLGVETHDPMQMTNFGE